MDEVDYIVKDDADSEWPATVISGSSRKSHVSSNAKLNRFELQEMLEPVGIKVANQLNVENRNLLSILRRYLKVIDISIAIPVLTVSFTFLFSS